VCIIGANGSCRNVKERWRRSGTPPTRACALARVAVSNVVVAIVAVE
jgi:hypothetical protein